LLFIIDLQTAAQAGLANSHSECLPFRRKFAEGEWTTDWSIQRVEV
jgi:hypothetical protein